MKHNAGLSDVSAHTATFQFWHSTAFQITAGGGDGLTAASAVIDLLRFEKRKKNAGGHFCLPNNRSSPTYLHPNLACVNSAVEAHTFENLCHNQREIFSITACHIRWQMCQMSFLLQPLI